MSYQQIDVESQQLEVAQPVFVSSSPSSYSKTTKFVAGLGLAAFVGTALFLNSSSSTREVEAMSVVTASPLQAVRPMVTRQQSQRRQSRTAAMSRPQASAAQPFEEVESQVYQETVNESSSSTLYNAGAFATGAIVVAAAVSLLTPGAAEAKFDKEAKQAAYKGTSAPVEVVKSAPAPVPAAPAPAAPSSTSGPKKFDKASKQAAYKATKAETTTAPAPKAAPAPAPAAKSVPVAKTTTGPKKFDKEAKQGAYKAKSAEAASVSASNKAAVKDEIAAKKTGDGKTAKFDKAAKKAAYLSR